MNANQLLWLIPVIALMVVAGFFVFAKKTKVKSKPINPSSSEKIQGQVDPALEQIEPAKSNNQEQSASKFNKSQSALNATFNRLFGKSNLVDSDWTELEDELILADVGATTSAKIVNELKKSTKSTSGAELKVIVKAKLIELVDGGFDRSLKVFRKNDQPAVVLTVGVNGTGKTTTTGKLARKLVSQDLDVVLGAADTFRAAASEQLTTWADRIGVPVVRGALESDPAAVAFEAVKHGIENEADVVLIDTAGRLHNKQSLMDELGKVYRVASKSTAIDEVLLVIDATTGQNGLNQARVFAQVVPVTGIVLTKLDGTAKGGIVIAVQQELGIPVKLVGIGEGADDLVEFNPTEFVSGLIN